MRAPTLRLPSPSDVPLRKWVMMPFSAEAKRAYGIDMLPEARTPADHFPTFHRMVCARVRYRDCPVSDVVSRVMMAAAWQPDGFPEPLPLAHILQLLERVTITVPWYPGGLGYKRDVLYGPLIVKRARVRSGDCPPPEVYLFRAALYDFKRGWVEWCCSAHDRDLVALQEYDTVYRELVALSHGGRPVRYILQELVGPDGRLSLGFWSCVLRPGWRLRAPDQEAPSAWAEFLLAEKWRCSVRDTKERRARARAEQEIARAWGAYGEWLGAHPEAISDLEPLLGGLPLGVFSASGRHTERADKK